MSVQWEEPIVRMSHPPLDALQLATSCAYMLRTYYRYGEGYDGWFTWRVDPAILSEGRPCCCGDPFCEFGEPRRADGGPTLSGDEFRRKYGIDEP